MMHAFAAHAGGASLISRGRLRGLIRRATQPPSPTWFQPAVPIFFPLRCCATSPSRRFENQPSSTTPPHNNCPRLEELRIELARRGVDAFVVPSGDAHNSEYAASAFGRREFISGFTGSAGTAVITPSRALLWTDGRYFLQAEAELEPSWELMRAGEPSTPLIHDFLATEMPSGARVAIDPFVHPIDSARTLREALEQVDVALVPLEPPNPVDVVWGADRPSLPQGQVRVHPMQYAGKSVREKLSILRDEFAARGVEFLLASMLDEVCWLYNIRGEDVAHCPIVLSYALVGIDEAVLYIDPAKVNDIVRAYLVDQGVRIEHYDNVVPDLRALADKGEERVWLDPTSTSEALRGAAGGVALCEPTPIPMLKAVKNEAEVAGMRAAHLRDGAALSSFLCWLEDFVRDGATISEVDAAAKLEKFRAAQDGFVTISFTTIAGSGKNGAIIHYSAKEGDCAQISKDEVFLLDSGGQYRDGTTDVTRTMHLGGAPTKHERECFTRVLQGHIAIDSAIFPENTTGLMLDTLARVPLWTMGLDYRHGTGHGVGACLNVHEGPQSISSRIASNKAGIRAGMIISNEPGYYENNNFGIRIENLLHVVEKATPYEFGGNKFLGFERLTFAPIDKSMVLPELLSEREVSWLNSYHAEVWEKVSPLIKDERHREWLREKTMPLYVESANGVVETSAVSSTL